MAKRPFFFLGICAAVCAAAVFAACKNPWIPTLDKDKDGVDEGPPPQYAWVVTTIAGSVEGLSDGVGTATRFRAPTGITADAGGTLYVTDTGNHRIRKITSDGLWTVSSITAGGEGFLNDPSGSAAKFRSPAGIIAYGGNLYVADTNNHIIRSISLSSSSVGTFAGTVGTSGLSDGPSAQFYHPQGITAYGGNLYVADTDNNSIREIDSGGSANTIATGLNSPQGITVDAAGNLYVADSGNHSIRKIANDGPRTVTTIAGNGGPGLADGPGAAARFSFPKGITVDAAGNLYVTDFGNHNIRKIANDGPRTVTTIAGAGDGTPGDADGVGTAARFENPQGISVDTAGNLYVADTGNYRIRKLSWQRIN
ncbi:MAG: hypothetical protein LBK74_00600 [Treponema sp.]|nr:hypothetical protein [Treponema sp.]